MKLTGENRSTRGKKPVPMPLCPPQIPHGPTRDSAVRGRRLTAWAIARPILCVTQLLFWAMSNCLIYLYFVRYVSIGHRPLPYVLIFCTWHRYYVGQCPLSRNYMLYVWLFEKGSIPDVRWLVLLTRFLLFVSLQQWGRWAFSTGPFVC
jgi:hypothetical protein